MTLFLEELPSHKLRQDQSNSDKLISETSTVIPTSTAEYEEYDYGEDDLYDEYEHDEEYGDYYEEESEVKLPKVSPLNNPGTSYFKKLNTGMNTFDVHNMNYSQIVIR